MTLQNVTEGLVVNKAVLDKRIQAELPFMATENVIMAMVKAGGDRQQCHEIIRVLSHDVGRKVKDGQENNLMERLQNEQYFAPISDQVKIGPENTKKSLFDPSPFIGLAPQQVVELIQEEVEPTLEKYRNNMLDEKVELNV